MDTWVIYVRSKTLDSDEEAVHIWKEEMQRQNFKKNPNSRGKTPRTIWNIVLFKSCLYGNIWKVLV